MISFTVKLARRNQIESPLLLFFDYSFIKHGRQPGNPPAQTGDVPISKEIKIQNPQGTNSQIQ